MVLVVDLQRGVLDPEALVQQLFELAAASAPGRLHQADKGLRPPLPAFNLQSEPWLFVVDKCGRITARLEGSFWLDAFETAVKSGL